MIIVSRDWSFALREKMETYVHIFSARDLGKSAELFAFQHRRESNTKFVDNVKLDDISKLRLLQIYAHRLKVIYISDISRLMVNVLGDVYTHHDSYVSCPRL